MPIITILRVVDNAPFSRFDLVFPIGGRRASAQIQCVAQAYMVGKSSTPKRRNVCETCAGWLRSNNLVSGIFRTAPFLLVCFCACGLCCRRPRHTYRKSLRAMKTCGVRKHGRRLERSRKMLRAWDSLRWVRFRYFCLHLYDSAVARVEIVFGCFSCLPRAGHMYDSRFCLACEFAMSGCGIVECLFRMWFFVCSVILRSSTLRLYFRLHHRVRCGLQETAKENVNVVTTRFCYYSQNSMFDGCNQRAALTVCLTLYCWSAGKPLHM